MSDPSPIDVARDVRSLRARVGEWHRSGETVGLVPTMGALHAGHASLIELSRSRYSRTVMTLFVNPKQFNDARDLDAYPRTEAADFAKAAAAGADLVYAPPASLMYPPDFATTVSVGGVSEGLCGAARPGHFDGVATVVTKLFLQSGADGAFFGEKDFQQLAVIRRFVRDLDIPIEVIGAPTIREADGLAMSSRNAYLNADERRIAPALQRALVRAGTDLGDGRDAAPVLDRAQGEILAAGFREVDYVELRSEDDLTPLARLDRPARLLAAARIGSARLIDNIALRP